MAFKIIQDLGACIGCGACAAICPTDWRFEGDKAILVGGKKEGKVFAKVVKEAGCNKDVETACPVKCIKIEQTK